MPTARCGTITVPLDRAHPAAGTTTLGFALVPCTDQTQPALSTIAVNPGGPGHTSAQTPEGLRLVLDFFTGTSR